MANTKKKAPAGTKKAATKKAAAAPVKKAAAAGKKKATPKVEAARVEAARVEAAPRARKNSGGGVHKNDPASGVVKQNEEELKAAERDIQIEQRKLGNIAKSCQEEEGNSFGKNLFYSVVAEAGALLDRWKTKPPKNPKTIALDTIITIGRGMAHLDTLEEFPKWMKPSCKQQMDDQLERLQDARERARQEKQELEDARRFLEEEKKRLKEEIIPTDRRLYEFKKGYQSQVSRVLMARSRYQTLTGKYYAFAAPPKDPYPQTQVASAKKTATDLLKRTAAKVLR